MIRIILLLLYCFCLSTSYAQTELNATDWQADLRFLQKTVHQDYPFLFKKTTAAEFDAAADKLYQEISSLQAHEIVAGFSRLIASFQYGHTDISWRQAPVKFHIVPLNLYQFSDGIFVEGAHADYANALGARLVEVEGVPVGNVLDAIRPLMPAENDQFFKAYGLDFLLIPEALHAQGVTKTLKNSLTLRFEKDGKPFEQSYPALESFRIPRGYGFSKPGSAWLSVRDNSKTPLYLKNLDKIYFFEYLPEYKTLYLRHSQIQDEAEEPTPAFYARVFDFIEKNDVERLVLDVRLNGGGNNYKNKPIVTGLIRCEKINQPGKLFVIIGRRTFSACQNLVNELHNYTNAIFVGEPTGENINFYGDNNRLELPNSKIPVFLSFAWWQDKPQWENADWLAPQLAVDMRFEDYRTNRDPVLDAVLDFSENDIILDPFAFLKELFMAKKLAELEAEANKIVQDPKYRYVNLEDPINRAGYDLMRDKQLESALYVFQLNAKLYPKSANAWDSLGEGHWKSGDPEKAIECYNKAISLDPNGSIGANSREMLRQIAARK
jgi:tetratricopeptide (TPR) repeat protein